MDLLLKNEPPKPKKRVVINFEKPTAVLKKKPSIFGDFTPAKKEQDDEDEDEEQKDEINDDEEQDEKKKPKVMILDKRKISHIDRDAVLKRLELDIPHIESEIVSQAPSLDEEFILKKPKSTKAPMESRLEEDEHDDFGESSIIKNSELNKSENKEFKRHVEQQEKDEQKDEDEEEQQEKDEQQKDEEQEKEQKEQDEQKDEEAPVIKGKERKKRTKKSQDQLEDIRESVDLHSVKIGKTIVSKLLPKPEKITLPVSPYYMNNRKLFIENLTRILEPYAAELRAGDDLITCDALKGTKDSSFQLLTHQRVVRDYLKLYSPYRGLLLYYSLGSGKTCTSIGIAEGMKSSKGIVLMTPASLKMNFFSELKKCGDLLFRKNQYWEFVSIEGQPNYVNILAQALHLDPEYIKQKKGAWMVDVSKASNFGELSDSDKESVDEQLDAMIRNKYLDINYNGLNKNKIKMITENYTKNPFDHKVVIIDEAHNFVSRIVNKLKDKKSISYMLYQYLMDATDVRIVLLTGTPIINYPNEVAVLFNILRGFIKSWKFVLQTDATSKIKKINNEILMELFEKEGMNTYDFLDYSGKENGTLTITRNPFGFVNIYKPEKRKGPGETIQPEKRKSKGGEQTNQTKGRKTKKSHKQGSKNTTKKQIADFFIENTDGSIDPEPLPEMALLTDDEKIDTFNDTKELQQKGAGPAEEYRGIELDETGNLSDSDFQKQITQILGRNGIKIVGEPVVDKYKCLPDDSEQFLDMFISIETGDVKNIDLFRRRVLGLTSYFRSSQEQLMPSFAKSEDGENIEILRIEMSSYQFDYYQLIRHEEREQEKKKRTKAAKQKKAAVIKDTIKQDVASSYRIRSRSACNFAFPKEHPRPLPHENSTEITENDLNAVTRDVLMSMDDFIGDPNEKDVKLIDDEVVKNYQERINEVLDTLKYNPANPRPVEYLTKEGLRIYSPKFLRVLENIENPENVGLHLLYSQFRTVEGIGLIKLVLEANGFAEFKLKKNSEGEWSYTPNDADTDKPKFVLYTGTETAEEKEIIRNIYNSSWEYVPPSIVEVLKRKSENNFHGEIIKVFMITSSGAEGINLRNTRFVHIVEPYWNMVRTDQVIGRARRICSHEDLPIEEKNVKVYLYISTLSKEQKDDEKNVELRINDVSKLDNTKVLTTDESLREISEIKNRVNQQILMAIKETAIDCTLYSEKSDENIVCYGAQRVIETNDFNSYPTLEQDNQQKDTDVFESVKWRGVEISDPATGKKYALHESSGDVYTIDSYQRAIKAQGPLVLVGKLVKTGKTMAIRFK